MKKIGILLIVVMVLTGCVQQIDLTQEESETIAAYAASVTLKYDKKYNKNLVETTDEASENNAVNDIQTENVESETIVKEAVDTESTTQEVSQDESNIADLLNLEGFQITYDGLLYGTQYKDENQESEYTVNSLEDQKFAILKFTVENTTDETKLCDILSLSPRLQISINGEEPIDTFASLLSNDMSTLFEEIEAHTSKEVVLLVEIPQEDENNISTLSITVIVNGVTSTIELI